VCKAVSHESSHLASPTSPKLLGRLLSSNASMCRSQPVQLVASETGPTITGVTPAKLQQYLYELCRAVSQVSNACAPEMCCALQQCLWAMVLQGHTAQPGVHRFGSGTSAAADLTSRSWQPIEHPELNTGVDNDVQCSAAGGAGSRQVCRWRAVCGRRGRWLRRGGRGRAVDVLAAGMNAAAALQCRVQPPAQRMQPTHCGC
jgi:hypothetical protein